MARSLKQILYSFSPACGENGECVEGPEDQDNFCICETGWKGDDCKQCVPYWECPNQGEDACNVPNECLCGETVDDPNGLCNNTDLVNWSQQALFWLTLFTLKMLLLTQPHARLRDFN